MKKSTTRVTIILICLIVAVVGYYAYLSNKAKKARADAEMTIVQETLSRDLENDYPATPKEVLKFYNNILNCFYNEDCTDEEIDQLGQKARELYDEELLAQNELGPYMIRLRQDIQEYKDKGRRITNFSVAASTSVKTFEADNRSFARILCGYDVIENKQNFSLKQVYLLRRDEEKRWKIYGWDDAAKLMDNGQSTSESLTTVD